MRILMVFFITSMVSFATYKAINMVTKGSTQTIPHNCMAIPPARTPTEEMVSLIK